MNLPPELLAAAGHTLASCRAAAVRVSTVESCTGGLVAAALTEWPGASDTVLGGWVTYANAAKIALGVPADLIATHGAVSPQVAAAMAATGLRASGAERVVAITGVAGPGGGSADKPVGLVEFALATAASVRTETKRFGDLGRAQIRLQAALFALSLLAP